jgi:hypothetical protein
VLRRTLVGEASGLVAAARASFEANGYAEETTPGAKTLAATRGVFRLEVEPRPAGAELRLSLPINDGDAARLLGAPISMTTEQLALYFPKPPGLEVAGERFEGIVVTNYLYRPLFPRLLDALAPGGVLIYETFMLGNERYGRPSNPEFLLQPGELLEAFGRELTVIAFEQGRVERPKAALIQRLCALRGGVSERALDAPSFH